MATFVALVNYTEKGIQSIKESPNRAEAFIEGAQKMGITIKELLWTTGPFDGLVLIEAADEETATAAMLSLADAGNVRTQTLRAYNRSEMSDIVNKMS